MADKLQRGFLDRCKWYVSQQSEGLLDYIPQQQAKIGIYSYPKTLLEDDPVYYNEQAIDTRILSQLAFLYIPQFSYDI